MRFGHISAHLLPKSNLSTPCRISGAPHRVDMGYFFGVGYNVAAQFELGITGPLAELLRANHGAKPCDLIWARV